jgi:hypothetical protein
MTSKLCYRQLAAARQKSKHPNEPSGKELSQRLSARDASADERRGQHLEEKRKSVKQQDKDWD